MGIHFQQLVVQIANGQVRLGSRKLGEHQKAHRRLLCWFLLLSLLGRLLLLLLLWLLLRLLICMKTFSYHVGCQAVTGVQH